MQLADLKPLLDIPLTDISKDVKLQIQLDAAISEAKAYCNQEFLNDAGVLDMPGSVKMGISILVKGMNTNEAIQSDSVGGGMSKTYRQGGYKAAARQYFKGHRKIKFIDQYEKSPWE